jgi:molybdopterin/thiamine biosynthesis adenylyltransferase
MGGRLLQVDVDAQDGRYDRQELISWWDQDRLAAARVLVVGAGALGNELVKAIALLGIGHVLIIDMDRVENSNLSRCVLFREADEGRFKAEVAAEAARSLNPDIDVRGIVGDARVDLGLGTFAAADIVLGGLDNREARLHVNEACWKVDTPWIDGAIEGLMGTVKLFLPPDSACYECTMSENDHRLIAHRKSCALLSREQMLEGKVPTTVTSAGVIAAMQVQEAIKLLHRDKIEPTLAGRGFVYNGLTHDSYVVTFRRRDDCLSHDTYLAAESRPVAEDASFGEILTQARDELPDPVLDLEREVVLRLECAACASVQPIRQPLQRVTVQLARCPACGEDRRPITTHSIRGDDAELLALRPSELGLPRFECVTARAGTRRLHFWLGANANEVAAFAPGTR